MKRIILFLFMSVCVSCNDVRLPDPSVRLVVEAWAEDNGRPVVVQNTRNCQDFRIILQDGQRLQSRMGRKKRF